MRHSLLLRLAVRNLHRHRRRTLMTVLGIAFGLAMVFWLECILIGRDQDVIQTVTSAYVGNLQIVKKEYREDPLLKHWFAGAPQGIEAQLPEGSRISERAHVPALLSTGEDSVAVLLEGVDPVRERQVSRIADNKVEGEFLRGESAEGADCEAREIYLSRTLARQLNASLGGKVVMLAQTPEGTLGNDLFRVVGLYESGSPQFDKRYAFASMRCLRKTVNLPGSHEVVIRLPEDIGAREHLDGAVQDRLAAGLDPALTVTSWKDVLPPVAIMVTFNRGMLLMISGMLLTVILIGVVNSLLISVFERTREFGNMTALGTTPSQVRAVVILESCVMALAAALAGVAIGTLAVLYHRQFGFDLRPFLGKMSAANEFRLSLTVHPVFAYKPFIKAFAATFIFMVVAAVYPAILASRLNPVEAMRSN